MRYVYWFNVSLGANERAHTADLLKSLQSQKKNYGTQGQLNKFPKLPNLLKVELEVLL